MPDPFTRPSTYITRTYNKAITRRRRLKCRSCYDRVRLEPVYVSHCCHLSDVLIWFTVRIFQLAATAVLSKGHGVYSSETGPIN